MMAVMTRRQATTIVLVALLFVTACGSIFPTKIGKILEDPRDYDGKVVTVKGTVKESVNIIFLKSFVVSDGTGEIMVTTARAVPRVGATVTVKGTVNQAFALGSESIIVVEEAAK